MKRKIDWNNLLFGFSIVCALVFIFVPFVLKIPVVDSVIREILKPLQSTEYKTAYFEACGAMLGSFVAVTSAIWVQKRSKKENELLRMQQ